MNRKQRILDHLDLSRRARQSSRFDDKRSAAQARVQRRLAAQRQESIATRTAGIEADRLAEADRQARQAAASAPKTSAGPKAAGDSATAQEWLDSVAQLMKLRWEDSRLTAQSQEPVAETSASRRNPRVQAPAATFTGPQSEIARLESRAKAETQRADFVVNLLEQVLRSSTASLLKHQARLEAMQAQINALQGR